MSEPDYALTGQRISVETEGGSVVLRFTGDGDWAVEIHLIPADARTVGEALLEAAIQAKVAVS